MLMTASGYASAAAVGLCWVATSAVLSTRGNSNFVATFHDAMAHNCVRFSFSSLCGYLYLRTRGAVRWSSFRRKSKVLLSSSVLLWCANFANSVSLERTGISVTYVFKSLIPFLTVLMCRLKGQQFSLRIYACLVPICIGVSLATITDLQFDTLGAVFAFFSALAQTGLNIQSKSCIRQLKVSGMEAFVVMSTSCVAISVPATLLWSLAGHSILAKVHTVGVPHAAGVIVQAGFTYFMEYSLNFAYVSCCTPLAFSITDICRRVSTVLYGAFLFNKPLTVVNAGGIVLSLTGALAFSINSLHASGLPIMKLVTPEVKVNKVEQWREDEETKQADPEVAWVSQYSSMNMQKAEEDIEDLVDLDEDSTPTDYSSQDTPRLVATLPVHREALERYHRWLDAGFFPAEATCVSPTGLCSWSVEPFTRQKTAPAPKRTTSAITEVKWPRRTISK
mmetsp:Transcript_47902/g.111738  ORF Transcript_47902/g.111738 Transcript_47902/m.111738 type:complete len:449 (+) Transcript_47902:55-1401(+)